MIGPSSMPAVLPGRRIAYQRYVLALIRAGAVGGRVGDISPSATRQEAQAMHAQLIYFDGPRTPEQLAASDFAAQERIMPAVSELGHRLRVYQLRGDDGSEIIVMIADSEQAMLDVQKAVMASELLPGEDPALLPGPDRIELYPVINVHDVHPASDGGQP
jgi:hypothetical protein